MAALGGWCRARRLVYFATIALLAGGLAARGGQAGLPAPWSSQDIGNPAIAGDTTYSTGSFTITAGGTDIWGSSDQFQFLYQPVTGDLDVRARVDSVSAAASWSKAGVMIRASLDPSSPHGYALVSAGRGLAFQRRTTAGGLSTHTAGEFAAAPRWVRLVRAGTKVTAYSSRDGATWTTIGSDTIQLGATAYVGIAVTSHNASAATTAVVSQIALTQPAAFPSGQHHADVGSPALPGSASYSAGTYTITAAGHDIWDASDQFHYVYQQASGDMDVKVRVASIAYASSWSKAGVMIRQSLTAGSTHAFALVSAGQGYAFQRRDTAGGLSVHTAGSAGTAPGWLRLKRSGDLITAYQSTDGSTWTTIGSDSIVMSDPVYVGIAVTSHNDSTYTTARADNFSVTASQAANQPPTVAMTAPANGASYTAPATIALAASASDPENQLSKVEFYSGTTLLGTDTSSPYTLTWSSVPAGTYSLTAVAYDAQGANTRSAAVGVTVTSSTATPATLDFTASPDHATLVTGYVLEIFPSTADTTTATPAKTLSLGKPTPDSTGLITVDVTTFFNSLAAGSYQATVSAVGSGGNARSAPFTFTR